MSETDHDDDDDDEDNDAEPADTLHHNEGNNEADSEFFEALTELPGPSHRRPAPVTSTPSSTRPTRTTSARSARSSTSNAKVEDFLKTEHELKLELMREQHKMQMEILTIQKETAKAQCDLRNSEINLQLLGLSTSNN